MTRLAVASVALAVFSAFLLAATFGYVLGRHVRRQRDIRRAVARTLAAIDAYVGEAAK